MKENNKKTKENQETKENKMKTKENKESKGK